VFVRVVQAKTGLSRSSIYARIAAGQFPKPIAIGARAVGWPDDLIDRWIQDRIRESGGNDQPRRAA